MKFQLCIVILTVATGTGKPLIPTNKLSLATWGSYYQRDHMGPGTYAFGYDIEDPATGNIQFRQEERHLNGTVTGTYGYVGADGRPNIVTYISDVFGYRAKLEVEGEPVKYFPDGPTFFGNSLRQDDAATDNNYLSKGNDIVAMAEASVHPHVPTTRTLDHPYYYKYIRATDVSK